MAMSTAMLKPNNFCIYPSLIIWHNTNTAYSASAAAAAITHLAETKGKDAYDSYKQKKHLEEGNRPVYIFTLMLIASFVATKLAQEAVTEDNYKH